MRWDGTYHRLGDDRTRANARMAANRRDLEPQTLSLSAQVFSEPPLRSGIIAGILGQKRRFH